MVAAVEWKSIPLSRGMIVLLFGGHAYSNGLTSSNFIPDMRTGKLEWAPASQFLHANVGLGNNYLSLVVL